MPVKLVVHETANAEKSRDAIAQRIAHLQELQVGGALPLGLAELSLPFTAFRLALDAGLLGARACAPHGASALGLLAQYPVHVVVGEEGSDDLGTTLGLQARQ